MTVHCPQMCSLGENIHNTKIYKEKMQKHYLVGANHGSYFNVYPHRHLFIFIFFKCYLSKTVAIKCYRYSKKKVKDGNKKFKKLPIHLLFQVGLFTQARPWKKGFELGMLETLPLYFSAFTVLTLSPS